jgi:hypothetical protein
MMEMILAASKVGEMAPVVFFCCYAFVFALVIICLIRVSRYFRTAGKEQKLLRIELGKLAEEVHQIREKINASNNQNTTGQ